MTERASQPYVLGHSETELRRLALQSALLRRAYRGGVPPRRHRCRHARPRRRLRCRRRCISRGKAGRAVGKRARHRSLRRRGEAGVRAGRRGRPALVPLFGRGRGSLSDRSALRCDRRPARADVLQRSRPDAPLARPPSQARGPGGFSRDGHDVGARRAAASAPRSRRGMDDRRVRTCRSGGGHGPQARRDVPRRRPAAARNIRRGAPRRRSRIRPATPYSRQWCGRCSRPSSGSVSQPPPRSTSTRSPTASGTRPSQPMPAGFRR